MRGAVGLVAAGETGMPVTSLGELPAPVAPDYNILTAATIITESDPHWQSGKTLRAYPQPNIQPWTIETGGASKPSSAIFRDVVTKGFTVVGKWECDAAGIVTPDEFSQRAQESFLAWECVAVEKQLWTNVLTLDPFVAIAKQAPSDAYPAGDSITILNSGTATQPVAALSEIEDFIGGLPLRGVIHCRPGFASILGWLNLRPVNGHLETILGTTAVVGVGYPGTGKDGLAVSALQEWVFATGPVQLRRSELIPFDKAPPVLDRDKNNWTIFFERNYVVAFDPLIHAAILVDKSKGLG
jgi:hypothetical protein